MRLGGPARYLTEVISRQEIQQAVLWAKQKSVPFMMIGDGSNIVWSDDGFPGLVIVNKITGFESFQEDAQNLYLTIGAGEDWDSIVERSVDMGYSGLEFLSLVPGSAGGTPIQNVGAYGREIKDVLVSVEAYDTQEDKFLTIPAADCQFGYRTSRFKATDKGRFMISSLTLHVTKALPSPPFYGALQSYLDEHGIKEYTPKSIREAVIAIRTSKLPDPAKVANNGSFFSNPIVSKGAANQLRTDHPGIVMWELEDGKYKLSAAWLVENAGFKGISDEKTGMATWGKQALVLVNEKAKKTEDLIKFRDKIIETVEQKFGVKLEQEPELI